MDNNLCLWSGYFDLLLIHPCYHQGLQIWNDQGLHNVNCWYHTMTVILSKLEALLNDLKEVALGSFEEQVSWLEEIDFCKELSMFRCSMLRRTVTVKQHHKWTFTLWLWWMEHVRHIDCWLWFQSSKAEDLLVSLFVITNHSQKCFANFTTSGIMCVIILCFKQHLNLIQNLRRNRFIN